MNNHLFPDGWQWALKRFTHWFRIYAFAYYLSFWGFLLLFLFFLIIFSFAPLPRTLRSILSICIGSSVITLENRSLVYLLVLNALISLCCLRSICVFDSVSCIRNIESKLLWSLCSMRHILKRQNLRSSSLSLSLTLFIPY